MLFLMVSLTLITAVCVIALLPMSGILDHVIAIPIVMMAQIVLLTQILSELYLISATGYLMSHLLLTITALSLVIWRRDSIQIPHLDQHLLITAGRHALQSLRDHWLVASFALFVFLYLSIQVGIHSSVQANSLDATIYHFPKAALWLQEGTARHFSTDNFRLTEFPPNVSFIYAWLMAFDGLDSTLLKWPQLIGMITLSFAIIGLAREAGGGTTSGVLAAAIFAIIPGVTWWQYFSGHITLVVAGLTTSGIYFAIRAIHQSQATPSTRPNYAILYTGLCVGLALGSKLTAPFILAPAGALLLLYTLGHYRSRGLRILRVLTIASLTGFLFFGSYNYILNFASFGNPISSQSREASTDLVNYSETSVENLDALLDPVANFLRYFYQMTNWEIADWNVNIGVASIGQAAQTGFDYLYDSLDSTFGLNASDLGYRLARKGYGLIISFSMLVGPLLNLFLVFRRHKTAQIKPSLLGLYSIIPWLSLMLFSALLAYSPFKLDIYLVFVPFALLSVLPILYSWKRWRIVVSLGLMGSAMLFLSWFGGSIPSILSVPQWMQELEQEDLDIGIVGQGFLTWDIMRALPDAHYVPLREDEMWQQADDLDLLLYRGFEPCQSPSEWLSGSFPDYDDTCWYVPVDRASAFGIPDRTETSD